MFAARRGRKKTPSLSLPPSSVHGGRLFIRAASPSVIHAIHNEPSLIWLGRGKRKENFEEEEKQVVPSATPAVPAGLPGRPSLSWGGTIVTSPILSYFVFSFFFFAMCSSARRANRRRASIRSCSRRFVDGRVAQAVARLAAKPFWAIVERASTQRTAFAISALPLRWWYAWT